MSEELLEKKPTPDEIKIAVYQECKNDILYWFNVFAWTFDPREENQHHPFITWDFQDKYILDIWDAINKGEDTLTEKSRDMGATWIILAIFVYGWMFHGYQFKAGSRKEELVDRIGDMDSLFERMRYIIKKQPKWLLPKGFDPQKHLSHMKIINPEEGNQILGEATTASFSRSGRYKAIMLDELAFADGAESIWQAAGDSAPCRLPISTPCGIMNFFGRLRNSKKIKVKTLHWTMHPKKAEGAYIVETKEKLKPAKAWEYYKEHGPKSISSPWYEREKQRRDHIAVAQELDIDYMASSGECVFDRQILGDMLRNAKNPLRDDRGFSVFREFDPTSNYVLGVDTAEGVEGGDNSACIVFNCKHYSVDAVFVGKPDTQTFAKMLILWAKSYNDALIVVEDNNHGLAVLNDIKDKYFNLYYRKNFDEMNNTWTKKLGWRTTNRTKPILIKEVKDAITSMVYIPSKEILGEMMTYVYHVPKEDKKRSNRVLYMGAQFGCHDDTVMALGCALQGYLEVAGENKVEVKKKLPRHCVQRMIDDLQQQLALTRHEEFFS